MGRKSADIIAKNEDPDQTASDLDLFAQTFLYIIINSVLLSLLFFLQVF